MAPSLEMRQKEQSVLGTYLGIFLTYFYYVRYPYVYRRFASNHHRKTFELREVCVGQQQSRPTCPTKHNRPYPINAMGISKALMEKVAIAASRNIDEGKTTVCLTRYGNVMASRGSVIPLFVKQIQENKLT